MKRLLCVLVLALSACGGGGSNRAPSNLNDACAILDERRGYRSAFRAAEKKWGPPTHVMMAMMYQESRFRSDARTPYRFALGVIPLGRQSSAYGYAQALDATWDEYRRETGRRSAKRNRIKDATDFMGWYMAGTTEQTGVALDDTRNQYLAYHDGRTGYLRGTYKRKGWLLRVSSDIAARADTYAAQLATCPR